MLGRDIFAMLIDADHINMVVRSVLELASITISTECLSSASTNTHRTMALAVFAGNILSLFWTMSIILGLATSTLSLDRLNVCVSVAASSMKCWDAF